jgi:flagellar biosynthetic protein FliP
MDLESFAVLVAGLGAVLLLVALGARLLRLWGGRLGGGPGPAAVDVVERAALTREQGLAVVRAGDRVLLVSTGEGGVRLLTELEDVELPAAAPERTRAAAPAAPEWLRRLGSAPRSLLSGLLTAALLVALPGAASAAPGPEAPVMLATAGAPTLALAMAQEAPAAQAPGPQAPGAAGAGTGEADRSLLDFIPELGGGDGEPRELGGPVGTVIGIGLLALIPTGVLLMTSFARLLIVLGFLRQALGTQTSPPGHLMAALALLLTAFTMAPTLDAANRAALDPWLSGEITQGQMLERARVPFRTFMTEHVRQSDLESFVEMSRPAERPESVDDVPLVVLTAAFVTSELRTAFQMGFVLFLPFVVIDLVVAAVLMSMGMFMLPPVMVSLPFKLLLFVLVDGWSMVMEGLVLSFQ